MGDRIKDFGGTELDVIAKLTGGDLRSARVLRMACESEHPKGILFLLELDTKRLYDERIWELFSQICGEDIERFKYHVSVELPNQKTGEVSTSGPFGPSRSDRQWWDRRKFGRPGSFWALENPPTDPNYEYPIG